MGLANDLESKHSNDSPVLVTSPSPEPESTEIVAKYGETKRALSSRHVQLMTIGGSIGTGLFVGIGGSLVRSGPLNLVLGFTFWSLFFILPLYLSVAEVISYLPLKSGIFELASRYVDPALGFALGWVYFYAAVMLVCVEYSAIASVVGVWNPDVNPGVWIAMAMVVCVLLNVVGVRWFGEAEFVMASTKVLLLIGLIMLTIITMAGGNPRNDAYGFRYWGDGNYMHPYLAEGDAGRFLAWWKVVLYAGFTVAGPDMLALSAGEIVNPRRTIPRAAKLIFYRLVGFYIVGVLCVGILCSSRDEGLMAALDAGSSGSAASPWVIGIQNLGISGLPDLINLLILLSAWSCGNAYLYSSSRTLYGLARDGQAPRFLLKCTNSGVPIYCVGLVTLISCITFLVTSNSAVTVFFWFIDLTTTGLICTYTMMLFTFIGWYRAKRAQGLEDSSLPYLAPWNPYAAYCATGLGCVALIFIGFDTFGPWNLQGFITSYFCLPYAVVLFFGWKIVKKTKLVDPKEADLISGKAGVDRDCAIWEEGGIEENHQRALAEMSVAKRTWEKLW